MLRWSHGHTLVSGGVLTLLLVKQNLVWLLLTMFLLGAVIGRLWFYEAIFAAAMRRRVHHAYDVSKQKRATRERAERLREQERLALERDGIPY